MALKAAMWVHGTAVSIEGSVEELTRSGNGVLIRGKSNATTWFHFPIATPVILDGNRLRLVRVFAFYDTLPLTSIIDSMGPKLTNVRIFDGPNLVRSFDGLNFTGPHAKGIDGSNNWSISPPTEVFFGLSLSVAVHFPTTFSHEEQTILFTTAGADFEEA